MGSCKVPGDQDSNQQWLWDASTQQLKSLSTGAFELCLSAAAGPPGGLLYSVDQNGNQWCLSVNGAEGDVVGSECSANARGLSVELSPVPHQSGNYSIVSGTQGVTWNGQFGASGPWPYTRYLLGGSSGLFTLDINGLTNGTGSVIAAASNTIISDDLVGNVTTSGGYCLDFTTMGTLEVSS